MLQELEHLPAEHLRETLISCMDAAEDALLLRADQAVSNASQNRYFEVLGDLRNQRRALIDGFLNSWHPQREGGDITPARPGLSATNPVRYAFNLLEDVSGAVGGDVPLPLAPRFRNALAQALAMQELRPEGRLALLKAIESRCAAPADSPSSAVPAAWMRVLSGAPDSLPEDPAACLREMCKRVPQQVQQEHPGCVGRLEKFLHAWAALRCQSGLPPPALQRMRAPFAAAWFDDAFPATASADDAAGAGLAGDCTAGDWIEFAGPGRAGLRRYLVVHVDAEHDLVGLANELHVVFESMPLSHLSAMLETGVATSCSPAGRVVEDFGKALYP